MKRNLIILVTALFIFQGCALQTGLLNPQPELGLTKTDKSINLVLDNKVPDNFTVPEYAGVKNSKVTLWRSSLHNGFKNGFQPFYKIVKDDKNSDLTIKLSEAGIKFIPVSVSGYQNATALKVQLDFKATVSDNTVKHSETVTQIVFSDKMIYHKGEEQEAVSKAIEKMYQTITDKSFIKNMR